MKHKPIEVGDVLINADIWVGGQVHYYRFTVTRLTTCGFWMKASDDFVRVDMREERYSGTSLRFAQRTEEEALLALQRRKLLYWKHCLRRLDDARKIAIAAGVPESKMEPVSALREMLEDY